MVLSSLDQALVYAYFAASLVLGAWVARRAGKSSSDLAACLLFQVWTRLLEQGRDA